MPKQPTTSAAPSKPYERPSTPLSESNIKPKLETPKKSPSRRTDTPGRKWTSGELLTLFNHVMKNGPRDWDNAVHGRTANQCNQTWGKTLLPFIKQSIESKGV